MGPSVDVVDPAPDATPWFGMLCLSALSLFPAKPAPTQTHGQLVGFLFSCRSRVLNNIQKDSVTYRPMLAMTLLALPFLPNIFPLYILGRAHADEKEQMHNGAILRKSG